MEVGFLRIDTSLFFGLQYNITECRKCFRRVFEVFGMKKSKRMDIFENKYNTAKGKDADIIDLEEMLLLKDEQMTGKTVRLYHGSTKEIVKPDFSFDNPDNDYGKGFYTTPYAERADDWAVDFGGAVAIRSTYLLYLDGLNILNLENYGTLSWIAEIISNRSVATQAAQIIAPKIVEYYKIDTIDADVIVGYRADDGYMAIIERFLLNQITIDETKRLFYRGDLGLQVFIKSRKAFEQLIFECSKDVRGHVSSTNYERAQKDVSSFLANREKQILLQGYQPRYITAREAVEEKLKYVKDGDYYVSSEC